MTEQRDGNGARFGSDAWIRAFVHIRAREIAYLRRGNGAPVVLIASDARLHERLLVGLAGRFKVFAPLLPESAQDVPFGLLLRDLVDGIGLARPPPRRRGCAERRSTALRHWRP